MPDGTGGVATGVYWVITGRLPSEELKEGGGWSDESVMFNPKGQGPKGEDDPEDVKDKRGRWCG